METFDRFANQVVASMVKDAIEKTGASIRDQLAGGRGGYIPEVARDSPLPQAMSDMFRAALQEPACRDKIALLMHRELDYALENQAKRINTPAR